MGDDFNIKGGHNREAMRGILNGELSSKLNEGFIREPKSEGHE